MNIYIFIQEIRRDGEQCNDVKVFKSLNEATTHLINARALYRKDAQNDEWVIDSDTETSFEAYENGHECHNHYYFNILMFVI